MAHDDPTLCGSTDTATPIARQHTWQRFLAVSVAALVGLALVACTAPQQPAPAAPAPAAPAAKEAPAAFKGGGSLKILLRAHFIPAYDKWVDQWAKEWGQKNRVEVTVDHILSAQMAEKVAAEVAAQAGHDIIALTRGGEAYLYAAHLVDVSDLARTLGEKHGGWIPAAEQMAVVDGVWRGVPEYFIPFPAMYRKDLFDEIGMKPNATWEELIKAGTLLKAKGHPIGIQINQKSNDANNTWNALLWSYGASFVAKDGKTVTINSPETRQALRVAVELYNKTMTNEVLSWDDAGNNRCLAAGRCSWIHNPISALRTIEKDNPDLAKKIFIAEVPAGPKGRFSSSSTNFFGIMRWSQNQAAAKAFITDYYAAFLDAFKASEGYNHPMLKGFLKKPMPILGEDPKLTMLQDADQWTSFVGYPGPTTAAAGEVFENWVIPLMVGRAVTSGNIDEAIGWAEQRIKAIYAKHK